MVPGLIKGRTPVINQNGSALVKPDPRHLDLADRLRTSEKETLYTHTNISSDNHTVLKRLSGAGAVAFNYANASADLSVGTASGDKATRQSYFYMPYLPGSPMLLKATGIFAPSKENVAQRIGVFDDNDGLFFEDDGTGMGFVRRTSTSGSVVNNRVAQSSWNVDPLDGTGQSRKNIASFGDDLYLFWIEYLWQGAVGYRAGIVIDGVFVPVHEDFSTLGVPFMRTPSLPIRYEIENTGAAASGTTLKEVCVDMAAEGGHRLVGSDWSVKTPLASGSRRNVTTTESPVLAIRLKNQYNGNDNRRMLKFLQFDGFTDSQDCHFRAAIVHDPTSITGAWQDVDTDHSGVEYSTDVSAITGGDVHTFDDITVPATASRPGEGFSESRFEDTHTIASQNIDSDNSDVIVIYATALATNTDVIVSAKFLEFE